MHATKARGIFNAYQLKLLMLFLMLLDHMYEFLFPFELLPAHYVARVVAPVFAFFAAQGMVYTRSREGYLLRLFAAGAVMTAGNFILYLLTGREIPNNIFFSLAVGAAAVYAIDKCGQNKWWALSIAPLSFASLFCEGGHLVPLMMLIFYYLRALPALMYTVYVFAMGLPFFLVFLNTGRMQPQFYMVFAVLPLMLYNGRRGPDTVFAKYLFYVFYPVHIWILFIVSFIVE